MATAKQTEANRRNAQQSTGPRTEAGKRTSSLNAYKHGLTGQRVVLTAEEAEARDRFTDALVADLKPVGAMEETLAQSIADSHWRIHRAVAIEDNIFAAEAWNEENRAAEKESDYDGIDRALAPMRTFTRDPQRFHLLTTYEMRLHRKAQADLKQLRAMQAERRAEPERNGETPRPAPGKTAPLAVQTPESERLNRPNGFVCSLAPMAEKMSEKEIEEFFRVDPRHRSQPGPPAVNQPAIVNLDVDTAGLRVAEL
jgi:hypothetical protein